MLREFQEPQASGPAVFRQLKPLALRPQHTYLQCFPSMIYFLLATGLLVGTVALTIVVVSMSRRRRRRRSSNRLSDHLGSVSHRWLTEHRAEN
jgi:hypothetical protein